jgi:hypothetical protein
MKTTTALTNLLLGCATLTGGNGVAGGSGAAVPAPASLELKIASQIGPIRDARFELTLKNRSNGPLWINTRLALDGPTPPGLSEVWLEVTGPSGRVEFDCKTNRPFASVKNYAVLQPNETVTRSAELRCFEGLEPGVDYTARAHYQDRNDKVPPAPAGAVHLGEEIVSASVTFHVAVK